MIQESYLWIRNCILSSTNEFHLKCCRKMIELFDIQFSDHSECKLMVQDLKTDLMDKETSINVFN